MQIKQLEQGIAFDQKSMKRLGEQLKIAEDFYERQKSLFRQGLISELKLEEERLKVADVERQRDLLEGGILEKNREIVRLRNSIQSENYGQQENTTSSSTRLFSSLNALRSSLDRWMLTYLLSAPIEGNVALNGLKSQQFVRMGEEVMTIVPQSHDSIIGQVQLPVEKSGKVAAGQKVVMKLDNYPYQEFGTVTGKVTSKSLVPKNREYTIKVEGISVNQDGKMLTSTGKEIAFGQQLLGTAEIVTEDKSFLQRVFEQLRAGFN
jgi:multidrug resistance efflux pump